MEKRLKEEAEQALDRDRRTLQLASITSGAGTPGWRPKNTHVSQHAGSIVLHILSRML